MTRHNTNGACPACHGRGWMPEGDGKGQEPCELCESRQLLEAIEDEEAALVEPLGRLRVALEAYGKATGTVLANDALWRYALALDRIMGRAENVHDRMGG